MIFLVFVAAQVQLMLICSSSLTAEAASSKAYRNGTIASSTKLYLESNDLPQSSTRRCETDYFHTGSSQCVSSSPINVRVACLLQQCGISSNSFLTSTSKHPIHGKIVADQVRSSIGVSGSSSLTVNLSLLRKSGLIFNQFSVVATMRRHARCFARSLADRVRFKIKFDGALKWSRTFGMSSVQRTAFQVPSTVRSISLIIKRLRPVGNPIHDCFVTEWLEPTLTQRMPPVSSRYSHCLSSATVSGSLHLHCLLPFCSGDWTSNITYNRFVRILGSSKVCGGCNATKCSSIHPLRRSIFARTNSSVAFHLGDLRNDGYVFTVFRTGLTVEQSVVHRCPSKVDFLVFLDGQEVRRRTVGFEPNDRFKTLNSNTERNRSTTHPMLDRDLVLVVSGAEKLTLVVTTAGLNKACRMNVKWHNPRLLKSLPAPTFTSCNETCFDKMNDGRLYLSCFMGVCDRTVARSSYLPFFTLGYHHDAAFGPGFGIGANTAGSWMDEISPIRLTDRNGSVSTFDFGIGAYPRSSITFHLDAFRSHGYNFNFFLSTLGINSHSGCNITDRASAIFRVFADNAMVIDKPIHDMRTSETILYDVRNTDRLTMVTRVGFPDACRHAVWAGAELVAGQFSRPASK